MCSAPITQMAVRSSLDVITAGGAEIGGFSKKVAEKSSSVVAPTVQTPAPPAMVTNTAPVQKTGPTPSGNADAEAAQRARKAAALRAGIMSTIGPNLGSIGDTTPKMAFATGMKTALGQ
jgi:hypothetical protein